MKVKLDTNNRSSDIAFVLIVAASYLSTAVVLVYSPMRPWTPKLAPAVVVGAAYLVNGIYGFAICRRNGSFKTALLYCLVQLILASSLFYLLAGIFTVSLIMLPLASQCVTLLPTRWLVAICATIILIASLPTLRTAGLRTAALVGSIYLAFLVFIVASTYIAVKERRTRTEIERLATELTDANLKLREYTAKVEELATTKERNRLAREIHDSLGHYLTVINIQLEAAQAVMDVDNAGAREALKKAQVLAQDGLVDVRQSVAALRTSPAEDRPLPQAVAILVDEIRAAGIEIEFSISGVQRPLHPHIGLTLYRTAQEGLTNIRKHSSAKSASVVLDYADDATVSLVLHDDGVGSANLSQGFGLLGISERTQLLGGEMQIQAFPGQGFTLMVKMPS